MPILEDMGAAIAEAYKALLPVLPLVGVLIGSGLTFAIQRFFAARTHRRDLALSALEALTTARSKVTLALLDATINPRPLLLPDEATAIWVRFEMLAALERRGADRRALAVNGMTAHEMLMGGAESAHDLEALRTELSRLTVVLLAWERGRARGRDFRLPRSQAFKRFGPNFTDKDLPPDEEGGFGQGPPLSPRTPA